MENQQNNKNDPEKFKVEFRRLGMLLKKKLGLDKETELTAFLNSL